MQVVERDYIIIRELSRWRFALGRHIRILAGFPSVRTADRRLKALVQAGYISRRKVLYGVPSIYTLTAKGLALINKNTNTGKIRVEQIIHDIAVLDSVICFIKTKNISLSDIITEKEMHGLDGFGNRKHQPDYVFKSAQVCVEVELSLKGKARLIENIKNNFMTYNKQIWIVPSTEHKIMEILRKAMGTYTGIELIELEEIQNYVKGLV